MSPVRTVSSIPAADLGHLLGSSGLRLVLPPFVMHIRSAIPVVQEGIETLYADHTVLPSDQGFADFHLAVLTRRRWFRPLCVFELDGLRPFTPLAVGEAYAFLEWGMNWCVTGYGHAWITLHAAVLEKKGRAVILPAPPGSGKSTLCAALMLHGWRLLSDEMALLDPQTLAVTPSPRPVSLKNQSIDLIRALSPASVIGPVAHDTLKGRVGHLRVTPESLLRAHEPARPAWIVFPRYEAGSGFCVSARGRAQALMEITSNSFNHHVHGRAGFDALVRLVDLCVCHDLRYSDLDATLSWFDTLEQSP